MSNYLKDMRGRVVKAPEYRPSGDQNPEGRAAKRRRKQMERKNPAARGDPAADSVEAPRADRQELVRRAYEQMGQGIVDAVEEGQANRLRCKMECAWGQMEQPVAGGYFSEPGRSDVRDIFVGVDQARPDDDVTTVTLRQGHTMLVVDEASQVPQHVWDAVATKAKAAVEKQIEDAMSVAPVESTNRHEERVVHMPVPNKVRIGGRRFGTSILAAALIAMMGTETPKK